MKCLENNQKIITFVSSIIKNTNDMREEILKVIIHERMKAKSEIEIFRALSKRSGHFYEKEINKLLDRINNLDRLYEELMKKK